MKVAFLDRDGTIIKDYPDNTWKNIKNPEFLNGSIEFLRYIRKQKFEIIIITNQYLIGEGIITLEDYKKFNYEFLKVLKQNDIDILDIFYCPHAKNENCKCIKPNPGLINQALSKYTNIDMSKSFYAGDSICDKELAQKFNLKFYGIDIECECSVSSLKDIISFI